MKATLKKKLPEIILKNGKPSAVILNINVYQDMLEQLEDVEDLRMLEDMRKRPLKFRSLDDFVKEHNPRV
ncbi:MAG: type II toxin-antitoxin system Phd/YefM family antitoxin [Deltaproteobacteria bacterium]|nr:type II toxin-antitoxin system Phd/YefM family antitoxin [Deltaproteobacteria bacterium]